MLIALMVAMQDGAEFRAGPAAHVVTVRFRPDDPSGSSGTGVGLPSAASTSPGDLFGRPAPASQMPSGVRTAQTPKPRIDPIDVLTRMLGPRTTGGGQPAASRAPEVPDFNLAYEFLDWVNLRHAGRGRQTGIPPLPLRPVPETTEHVMLLVMPCDVYPVEANEVERVLPEGYRVEVSPAPTGRTQEGPPQSFRIPGTPDGRIPNFTEPVVFTADGRMLPVAQTPLAPVQGLVDRIRRERGYVDPVLAGMPTRPAASLLGVPSTLPAGSARRTLIEPTPLLVQIAGQAAASSAEASAVAAPAHGGALGGHAVVGGGP